MSESVFVHAGRAAGLISLAAYFPYVVSILRGKTRPNRATWWILLVVGLMLATSYFAVGATHSLWVPISYVLGPFFVALLSLRYGERGWTPFDRVCLLGAGTSVLLWWATASPMVALLINLFMDFLGILPTAGKAYHRPQTEDHVAWGLFFFGSLINLFAVDRWIFEIAAYPIYMFLGNGLIAGLVCWPRSKKG